MLCNGLNISQISRPIECSRKLVQNFRKHVAKYNTIDIKIRKPPPRKTSINMDRQILRLSNRDPFLTSGQKWRTMQRSCVSPKHSLSAGAIKAM